MARCRTIRRWLLEFASDGIDPAREAAFRAHLGACPACAAEWAEVAAVEDALAALTVPEPSEQFFDQLRDQVNQQLDELPLCPARRQLVPALSGVAVLILALAVGLGLRRSQVMHAPEPVLSTTRMAAAEAEEAAPARPAATAPEPVEAPPVVSEIAAAPPVARTRSRVAAVTPQPAPRIRPARGPVRHATRVAAARRTRRPATPSRPARAETMTGGAVRNSLADAAPAGVAESVLPAEPQPALAAAPQPPAGSLAVVAELPVARVRVGTEHAFVVAAPTDLPSGPAGSAGLAGPRGPGGDRGPAGAGGMVSAARARAGGRVDGAVTLADQPESASPAGGLEIAPAVLECEVMAVTVAMRSLGR